MPDNPSLSAAGQPQTPTRADSPGHRPQGTSSVPRADGSAPGLATTGASLQSIVFGLCPVCDNWQVEAPLDTDPELIEEAIIEHDQEDHPGELPDLAEYNRQFQQRLFDIARLRR